MCIEATLIKSKIVANCTPSVTGGSWTRVGSAPKSCEADLWRRVIGDCVLIGSSIGREIAEWRE
jgi:hypothetical protein